MEARIQTECRFIKMQSLVLIQPNRTNVNTMCAPGCSDLFRLKVSSVKSRVIHSDAVCIEGRLVLAWYGVLVLVHTLEWPLCVGN